ncbi:PREDICTED: uncharacterized protein LOC108362088 [Rhagoletis zephyria]|uniref:uncharacterized protein LOC108362088 n=1 Tax=Rhagoletis zephyria TaxID=28612 RepID=UPI00081122AD|nr:PREDICTED: uncharacterized protein LOC108362088 [Rhagoletis zephyria]XP_036346435.1 uncharacterized protein LOC118755719 [Rhagoletis pomonella]
MAQTPDVYQCQLCCRFHALQTCACFREMSVADRIEAVRVHKYCMNCLARSHKTGACPSRNSCRICKLGHHTLLHRPTANSTGERKPAQHAVGRRSKRETERRSTAMKTSKSKSLTARFKPRNCPCGRLLLSRKPNAVSRIDS